MNRAKVQQVADAIATARRLNEAPASTIDHLIREHGATVKTGGPTNTLRAGGITATCTWSATEGLLAAWTRRATIRLMETRS